MSLLFLVCLSPAIKAQSPQPAAPEFFIEAEVDNLNPYLGQQITYTLKRYQARDFPSPPHYQEHPFNGFWDVPLLQRPAYTATIGTQRYRVRPTHIALFPTVVGSSTIAPARLVIPGDGTEPDRMLDSRTITVQVRPLPPDPPPHFKGAVGQFQISAAFNPAEGQVGDPMSLVVEVEGVGNIETLVEPAAPDIDLWIINMFGSDSVTEVALARDQVRGSRRFIWTVIPTQPGRQFFPAIRFSYFDPEIAAYESIRTEPIPVTIRGDERQSTFLSPVDVFDQASFPLAVDIRPIKPAPARLDHATPLALSWLLYGGGFVAPVILSAVLLWWNRSHRLHRAQTTQRARQRLSAIRKREGGADSEVIQIVFDYLAGNLSQPVSGLTSTQLSALLAQAGFSPALIERVEKVLAQADTYRFAPATFSPEAVDALVNEADQLIADLEQFFSNR